MAKLYAELTSDKGGRIASKGADTYSLIRVYSGNLHKATIKISRTPNTHDIYISCQPHMQGVKVYAHSLPKKS